jgi:hypothetical protein
MKTIQELKARKKERTSVHWLVCFGMMFLIGTTLAQTTYTSVQNGNFTDCATWNNPATIQQDGNDIFIIANNHKITIPNNTTVYANEIRFGNTGSELIFTSNTSQLALAGSGSNISCITTGSLQIQLTRIEYAGDDPGGPDPTARIELFEDGVNRCTLINWDDETFMPDDDGRCINLSSAVDRTESCTDFSYASNRVYRLRFSNVFEDDNGPGSIRNDYARSDALTQDSNDLIGTILEINNSGIVSDVFTLNLNNQNITTSWRTFKYTIFLDDNDCTGDARFVFTIRVRRF